MLRARSGFVGPAGSDTICTQRIGEKMIERIAASVAIFIGVAILVAYPCGLFVLMLVGSNPDPDDPILRIYNWAILVVPILCVALYNRFQSKRDRVEKEEQ